MSTKKALINMNNKTIVQRVVLGAIIIRNNKVLILQRHKNEDVYPNMWELPSGKREPLESVEVALIREAKEETGLDIDVLMPFSVFDYQIETPEKIKDSVQINFLVKPIGDDKVKLSSEHQNFAWVNKNELDQYELSKATKQVIQKAIEKIKG